MLTEPVPADFAALLDLRRDVSLLTPAERSGARALVAQAVEDLLGRLPSSTPECLVDAICELRYLADVHLDAEEPLETQAF